MDIVTLKSYLQERAQNTNEEFKRIFHGRGGVWESLRHLTIDSINATLLSVALYFEEESERELLEMLLKFAQESQYTTLVVQRRYLSGAPSEILLGELPQDLHIVENGIKFKLSLLSNQNSGYFPDMKKGREFVRANAKDKRVLNLFSYTCGFSLAAKLGGASEVVNVDMSKSALSMGKSNHSLNAIEPRGVSYLPYNILKSFGALKRKGPYDLIIIDPPSFQKGSFAATKDYEKIIKRLSELSSDECTLLACLNAPELGSDFLREIIERHAPAFRFVQRLANVEEFHGIDEERSLKNLIFTKGS